MIKITTLILFIFFLASCDTENEAENITTRAQTMLFTKRITENYIIFSPMEGVLLKDGKPLANTKIIRQLTWNGNEKGFFETFLTNEKGYFSLPLHEEKLSLNGLTQFVASASIEAEIEGKKIDIWYNSKFENGLHIETNGKVNKLVCELNEEELYLGAGHSRILTICRWEDMPKDADDG